MCPQQGASQEAFRGRLGGAPPPTSRGWAGIAVNVQTALAGETKAQSYCSLALTYYGVVELQRLHVPLYIGVKMPLPCIWYISY